MSHFNTCMYGIHTIHHNSPDTFLSLRFNYGGIHPFSSVITLLEKYIFFNRRPIQHLCRTNRNFNTGFKEHRKDFRYAEGKSKFSEHILKEGHEMKTIEEIMSIIHLENNHRKINTLEEIEILKSVVYTPTRDIRYTSMHRNHSMFTMRYVESIRYFEKLRIMRSIDVFS